MRLFGSRLGNGEDFLYMLAVELWKDWEAEADDATCEFDLTTSRSVYRAV